MIAGRLTVISTPPCKLIRGSEMGCRVYSGEGRKLYYSKASWCAVWLCDKYGLDSKKECNQYDDPWFDGGVSAEDVHLTNIHAPDKMDAELSKEYTPKEYADAREFIRQCAEANEGFSVSY